MPYHTIGERGIPMSTIGDCPHENCGESVWRVLPDVDLPAFSRETCPKCLQEVWMLYSRVDPQCFTPEQFRQRYSVDEGTKRITARAESSAASPEGGT